MPDFEQFSPESFMAGPEELRLENTTYAKVSVFMNVFNCHVNRVTTAG